MHPETRYCIDSCVEFGYVTPIESWAIHQYLHPLIDACIVHNIMPVEKAIELIGAVIPSIPGYADAIAAVRAVPGGDVDRNQIDSFVMKGAMYRLGVQIISDTNHRDVNAMMADPFAAVTLDTLFLTHKRFFPATITDPADVTTAEAVRFIQRDPHITRLRKEVQTLPGRPDYATFEQAINQWDWHSTLGIDLAIPLRVATMSATDELVAEQLADVRRAMSTCNVKAEQTRVRGAIKRAVRLFGIMGKQPVLTAYLSDGQVRIQDPNSNYQVVLRKERDLLDGTVGHREIAFDLDYLADGVPINLTSVCVYLHDAPLLDQLLGMTLLIENGELPRIIETGNPYNVNYDNINAVPESERFPRLQRVLSRRNDWLGRADMIQLDLPVNTTANNDQPLPIRRSDKVERLPRPLIQEAANFLLDMFDLPSTATRSLVSAAYGRTTHV